MLLSGIAYLYQNVFQLQRRSSLCSDELNPELEHLMIYISEALARSIGITKLKLTLRVY